MCYLASSYLMRLELCVVVKGMRQAMMIVKGEREVENRNMWCETGSSTLNVNRAREVKNGDTWYETGEQHTQGARSHVA